MRVLLVEDDPILGDGVKTGLTQAGNTHVDWFKTGNEALAALQTQEFDIVILDIGLPGMSGLEVLKELRSSGHQKDVPVLLLTARDTVEDRVKGLDSGADDYLTKPFDLGELSARIRALKRRGSQTVQQKLTYKNITLDPHAHVIMIDDEMVSLPRREFTLLQKLMENVGQVLSREQLTQYMYGWGEDVDSNTLEVHVHNLRKKFPNVALRTIRGIGYVLEKEA